MEQQPITHAPTSLDLVTFHPKDQLSLQNSLLESQQVTSAVMGVKKAQEDNFDDIMATTARLQEHKDELFQDYNATSSSQTVGAFYKKLYTDVTEQGATIQDINNLFRKCLKTYIPYKDIPQNPTQLSNRTTQKVASFLQTQVRKPDWFQKSDAEWLDYVIERINIPLYLHTGEKTVHASDEKKLTSRCYSHIVYEDQLPDWFEKLDSIPEKELLTLVEAEFLEDDEQRESIVKRLDDIPRVANNISKYYFGKDDKYQAWLTNKFKEYHQKGYTDLHSFLIYLRPLSSIITERKTPQTEGTNEATTANLLIDDYLKSHPFSSESIAVWLEENCTRFGVDKPGGLDKKILASVLRRMHDENALGSLWKPIQATDKKQYRFLRYELGELLKRTSAEERQILADTMEQEPLPKAILEIASNISEYADEIRSDEDANTVKVRKDVDAYAREWFQKNYRWLQSQLFGRIHKQSDLSPTPISPLEDNAARQESEPSHVALPIVEDESAVVNPIQQWKIVYTTSIHNPEGDNLIDLSSNNPQELIAKLEIFIRSQKIGSTVKTSSIVNCLEQIIGTPSEIEMLTPHLGSRYSEVDYKKRKRGGMRILYKLDPDSKSLTFWLHKKKSDTYILN